MCFTSIALSGPEMRWLANVQFCGFNGDKAVDVTVFLIWGIFFYKLSSGATFANMD